jgi:prolipoprotein diacylglyceryltransferase
MVYSIQMTLFSLLVGVGASLGLWLVVRSSPRWYFRRRFEAGFLVLLGALLGARLAFAALHSAYFSRHPSEILQVWLGGLSWPGAVLGGLIVVLLIFIVWKIPLARLLDALAPLVPPLAVAVWLGCWQAGSGYGVQAPLDAWWGVPTPDESGLALPRFPLQLVAATTLLLYYFLLDLTTQNLVYPGQKAALVLFGLALNLLVFSFFQADPLPIWNGLRWDTWAALGFTLLSIIICGIAFWRSLKKSIHSRLRRAAMRRRVNNGRR